MLLYEKKYDNLHVCRWNTSSFVPHLHHPYEILVCLEGTLQATCRDRTEILRPGNAMIAFSNDIHAYTGTDRGSGILLIVKPEMLPMVMEKVEKRRYENFLMTEDLQLCDLMEQILQQSSDGGDPILLYGYVNVLIGRILQQLSYEVTAKPVDMNLFSRVLLFVSEHYREQISLKSLSQEFGVDPSYLSRMFTAHFSEGFLHYLHELRVESAKHLLRNTGKRISEIMYESGFTDQKSFNRVFLSMTGQTPREYRASAK